MIKHQVRSDFFRDLKEVSSQQTHGGETTHGLVAGGTSGGHGEAGRGAIGCGSLGGDGGVVVRILGGLDVGAGGTFG